MFIVPLLGCLIFSGSSIALLGLDNIFSMHLGPHEASVLGSITSNPLIKCPISTDEKKNVSEIKVHVYYKNEVKGIFYIHEAADKILADSEFNKDYKLFVVIPGFNAPSDQLFPPFIKACAELENVYLLIIEHIAYTSSCFIAPLSYQETVSMIHSIGSATAKFLAALHTNNIHLCGHSFGGQTVGVAAAKYTEITKKKIPRCTGLDQCGPCFNTASLKHKLDKGDCEYVDCHHSNTGEMGSVDQICHADFYPNGKAATQPGCGDNGDIIKKINPDMGCSHCRAISLWLESVSKPENFHARKCDTWEDFNGGKCSANEVVLAGYHTTCDVNGVFIYRTNDKPEYGLGLPGAEPCEIKKKPEENLLGNFNLF